MAEDRDGQRPEPSVGNILGFALLFRDRRALLTLEGRALAPGVTLDAYEAEVPGVSFPLSGSLAPGRFRHRRCDAGHVRLSVEWWALSDWLRGQLVGRTRGGIEITDVELLASARVTTDAEPGPLLVLTGRVGSEPAWLAAPLRIRPRGHALAVVPAAVWLLAPLATEPDVIWSAVAGMLAPALRPAGGRTHVLDPVRLAVTRPFAAAGWKAPGADGLTLAEVEVNRHGVTLSLQRDATVAPAWPERLDPMATRHQDALHAACIELAEGSREAAWAAAEDLLADLGHERRLTRSLARWLHAHARFRDEERTARAASAWARAAPADAQAQRAVTVALAARDDVRGLARTLARQLRLPHTPRARAHLELALALLMVDRLGDAAGGLALLDPLVDRARSDPELDALLPQVLSALARTRARVSPGAPARAMAALEEALELREDAEFRADALSRAAQAFQSAGESDLASELVLRACREDPTDPELLDLAIETVAASGDDAAAIDLLERRVEQVDPATAAILRRRLADLLVADSRPGQIERALRHVTESLAVEPDAPDLLRRAARLHEALHDPAGAVPHLRRLLEGEAGSENPEARLRLATALRELGDREAAWEVVAPLTAGDAPLPRTVAELMMALAPVTARDALLDRLSGPDAALGAAALMERAGRQTSRERRIDDLRRAASLLEDPVPALVALAEEAEPSDPRPHLELALALAERGDVAGEQRSRLEAGLRHLGAGDLDRATAALTRASRLREDPDVLLALVAAQLRAGNRDEAAHAATRLAAMGLSEIPPGVREDRRLGMAGTPGEWELRLAELLADDGDGEVVVSLLRAAIQAAPVGSEVTASAAESLVDVLTGLGRRAEALDAALALAENLGGEARGQVLVRAAALAEPGRAATLLAHAHDLGVREPRVLEARERALREAEDWPELETLLRERLASERDPVARGRILDRTIDIVRQHGHEAGRGDRTSDLIDLHDQLLSVRGNDPDAALTLAALYDGRGHEDRAIACWKRALKNLAEDDTRAFAPALRIAKRAADDERPDDARAFLDRALAVRPGDRMALELLARVSRDLEDDDGARRAAQGLLLQAGTDGERVARSIQLARAEARLDDINRAFEHLTEAAGRVEVGSSLHVELAECWLELAAAVDPSPRARPRMEAEARARAEMRRALGRDQDPLDVRTEARLLLELDQDTRALEVLRVGLEAHPAHELLLSALKEVTTVVGDPGPYLDVLDGAIESSDAGEGRDRLATELAFSAMEHEDAPRVLAALDRLSDERSAAPELMDLRDWAIRALGKEDEELRNVETRLLSTPTDATLHARLRRIVGEAGQYVDCLLDLAERMDEDLAAQRMVELALDHACERARDPTSLLRAVRAANRVEAISALLERWDQIERLVLASHDEGAIADLIMEADDAARGGYGSLAARADDLLDRAMALMPSSSYLHRALWTRLRSRAEDADSRAALARKALEDLAARHRLTGQRLASLFTAHAELLDRRRAAALLRSQAEAHIDDGPVFSALLTALESGNHWPEVLDLLERRAERCEPAERVDVLKHLAHVCGDVLDDASTAIVHLEAALNLAPTDPDLLLSLLDLHYARTDLERAVELTVRVLEHVPMGDDAFAALAHRATDAAVARNDLDLARQLLERVLARAPDDARSRARLEEVEAMSDDPEHRVRMLGGIASRHGGSSRIEALEERARLLLDPLERVDEAIDDLRAVVAEAPERRESANLLADLLERRGRWADLVSMLEGDFPRLRGVERSTTLARVAAIYRSHLFDLPRAEQALRLALENLGTPPSDPDLAEDLRIQLLEALEQQGRYMDLGIYLERELAPELGGLVDREDAHPARVELLARLARVQREYLDDESKAARIYERLERLGQLPDEGLASLARHYRSQQRHQDLVRILTLRSHTLGEADELERKAEVDQRIAELLEGPLGRPHEAAHFWLDAYLANPAENRLAGARARLLLAGTDAVVNVRRKLHERADRTPVEHRPALLALLADVLAPHEEHEEEAETTYRRALDLAPTFGAAQEGLGRLLARQGRLSDAVGPLGDAARNADLDPHRAAENAAIAARALHELGRAEEAEQLLRTALGRAPDAQRALLELSRLYHRLGRPRDEAGVLDDLSELPLSAMLKAEVAYRRAMLLEPEFESDASSPVAERARAYLLEAVSADANHVAARQVLLDLARRREEWSIVAHMHYLAIRELPPGPQRALVHLDLAETYLQKLDDVESALRNIESAIQQAPSDVVVVDRTTRMAESMPSPTRAAQRFEHIAGGDNELDDAARARLWLLAADLRMREDDVAGAEAASQHVLALEQAPGEATNAAARRLETIAGADDLELRQQRAGLVRLLENEDQPAERLHMLGRLREVARALGEDDLVEQVSLEQLELAHDLADSEDDRNAAVRTLRELFAERGDYQKVVELYETLAARIADPERAAETLGDAARFALHGLRDARTAVAIVRRAATLHPGVGRALDLVAEISSLADERALPMVFEELGAIPAEHRTADICLQLSDLARRLGRHPESVEFLREVSDHDPTPHQELQALTRLSAALAHTGATRERIPALERALEVSSAHAPERRSDLAHELAQTLRAVGASDRAERVCATALEQDPSNKGLVRLHAELLEQREDWENLAGALVELSGLSLEDRERALWLTRAARVYLDHPELSSSHRAAIDSARKLLLQAREVAPRADEPRAALIPLSFTERRWEEVSQVAGELRVLEGDENECLVLAALTEALQRGTTQLAVSIANRHDANVRQRLLWPGVRHVLAEVAAKGPLPRLDSILSAAASVCGGGSRMMQELQAWASGQPLHPGLALALARLFEATGDGTMARHMYQIASFMAPHGPVERLVERLPAPPLPPDPLNAPGWSSLEERGALRTVLIRLRGPLSGIRGKRAALRQPTSDRERDLLRTAGEVVRPWREALRVALPLTYSEDVGPAGVGVRNEAEPCIALSPRAEGLSGGELRFRLGRAAAAISMGLAVVRDPFGAELVDVLDALGQVVNPAHRPTGVFAQAVGDAVAMSPGIADGELRAGLAEELVHWMSEPGALDRLSVVLTRAETLLATRLSGRLDGALSTIARDLGLPLEQGHEDAESLLRHEEAHWLLRALGLY